MGVTVETEIRMECPPEAITSVLLDADSVTQWTTDLERMEVLRGTSGEAGAVALLHYRQQGRAYVMRDELLHVEPNRCLKSRVSGDALSALVETTLTPVEGGTLVRIRWTGTGKPLMLKLLLPFMRGSIRRQALLDLTKLKDLAERRYAGKGSSSPD